jgi:hypothetical protein
MEFVEMFIIRFNKNFHTCKFNSLLFIAAIPKTKTSHGRPDAHLHSTTKLNERDLHIYLKAITIHNFSAVLSVAST